MPQFAKWRPQRFLPVSVSISVYLYLYVFLCVQRVLLNDFQLNLILFFSLFFFLRFALEFGSTANFKLSFA